MRRNSHFHLLTNLEIQLIRIRNMMPAIEMEATIHLEHNNLSRPLTNYTIEFFLLEAITTVNVGAIMRRSSQENQAIQMYLSYHPHHTNLKIQFHLLNVPRWSHHHHMFNLAVVVRPAFQTEQPNVVYVAGDRSLQLSSPSQPRNERNPLAGIFILACVAVWLCGVIFGVIAIGFAGLWQKLSSQSSLA